jgi:hypothetical protein
MTHIKKASWINLGHIQNTLPLRTPYGDVCMNLRYVMSLMQVGKVCLSVTISRIMHGCVGYIVSRIFGYLHI